MLADINPVQGKGNIPRQFWMCVCVCATDRVFVCVLKERKGECEWYSAVTNGNTQRRVLLNC